VVQLHIVAKVLEVARSWLMITLFVVLVVVLSR